ncbi:MAG: citrate synthase [Zetaproteobacteria bacterium CG06_land_8_20_14_3_00_59_53]|nr:MAG: citrate synthase [Zetaproteobacteria bacterium CG2_30_59_37]PIO90105.1 MAG: citrate synthase [Zetaproteobacteria bacterium CG23_combo_of_CG06-09_8_20_14_all_59_86]PIQ64826.1 MAG: citrate synthase [Zetaproteobacteria bacterium CG11_big_fil_rev_8_21_14_0_20_59_439]PIU69505.1 MAG: citrate synthase [Zetaproteobacteria bacterium CG06_land_8_20_14_3_00_59_53]PIU96742.1 MAG: citrate synthase [Zetaproteobacteria bacterium CG03_land_8_20_14_0_80_59_51]PIY46835.1 MAG: citrate synthase [Zetaprote
MTENTTGKTENIPCYAPGLAGIPVAESSVSFVDGKVGHLEYRGIDIEELAEKSSFEETAYLLLYGRLPTADELKAFDEELRHHRRIKFRIRDMMKCFPESAHPMDSLQATVAALGMFYPYPRNTSGGLDEDTINQVCINLIAKMPTLVAAHARMRHGDDPISPRDDLSHAANFFYMLTGEEPFALTERIMDVALIVHAEHTMNASTFSALVTASTEADPYSSISAAIGTLSGPLHGGANEDVLYMLDEIGTVERVEPYLNAKLAKKEKIAGLGHRVYKTKDPRATLLQKLYVQLTEKIGSDPTYEIARQVEELSKSTLGAKGVCSNVDFYSGIVYRKLGIPTDLFTPVFAVSRVAGWLAHWKEQLSNNRIYRPSQIYRGKHGQSYTPIEQR